MNTNLFLITGPSGAGKTALSSYLNEQGYTAVDTDSTPGLCYYVNKNGKPVPYPPHADAAWWDSHNYIWELDRLKKFLRNLEPTTKPIFICGNAGNIAKAWEMFAAVYYLDIPAEVMTKRLKSNASDSEAFGIRIDDQDQLMRWAKPFKAEMLKLGAITIDANRPLEIVANEIAEKSKALYLS